MPKQLNISLGFTADTSQAKRQLQDLQNQLTKLTQMPISGNNLGLTNEIQEASKAAAQLKVQLQDATNPNTGKLDLGKFTENMERSGMSIEKYKNQLSALGPDGNRAFASLADSIMSAEVPLRRSSQLLDQFWTTLKNTARWQFSSSALHAMTGAIQGAYGYAQDLNKSLTNIAIVTHSSIDNMRQFADQANKSAQALSTSTLAYTDAALIYYQQGLSGEDVTERVETTLRMSNVTGESAEEVSSYMTAIWNNFRTGSESIESFADKITALGAATASSSKEIAGGLQQFAAIAQTVGLSYDYAATALATVVSQTRQSESTVGNAFRTIFSRLEGLQMGETLEDGTTLNKYSGALETIGVSIKDQNGELKEMDTILNEIGEKWQTLSRDQQIALAQTVGGVRQYTNLIALFDNWDKFQENLLVSQNAEGELKKQAAIYGDSWEAAQKRVKAAWQALYQDLISDKFFITVLGSLEKILNFVDKIVDSAGGLKTIIFTLGAVLTTAFGPQLSKSLDNILYTFKMMTPAGREAIETTRANALNEVIEMSYDGTSAEGAAQSEALKDRARLQQALLSNVHKMSEEEIKYNQILLDGNKVLQKRYIQSSKKVDELSKAYFRMQTELVNNSDVNQRKLGMDTEHLRSMYSKLMDRGNILQQLGRVEKGSDAWNTLFEQLQNTRIQVSGKGKNKFAQYLAEGSGDWDWDDFLQKVQNSNSSNLVSQSLKSGVFAQDLLVKYKEELGGEIDDKSWKNFIDIFEKLANAERQAHQDGENLKSNTEGLKQAFQNAGGHIAIFSRSLVDVVQGLNQVAMGATIASEAIDTLNNKNLTFAEKFTKVLPQVAMGLPALANGFKVLKEVATGPILSGLKQFGTLLMSAITGGVAGLHVLVATTWEFLWPILAVVAAVAALKAAWDSWYATTPAGHIKEAREELEQANSALNDATAAATEATEAYEKLNEVLSGFEDRKTALEKMTEGTREWKKAVADNNLELLETLKILNLYNKDLVQRDNKTGMLFIAEEDRELLLDQAAQKEAISNINKLQASIKVAEKEEKVLISSLTAGLDPIITKQIGNIITSGYAQGVPIADSVLPYLGNTRTEKGEYQKQKSTDEVIEDLYDAGQVIADAGFGGKSVEELKDILSDEKLGGGLKNQLQEIFGIEEDLLNRDDILNAIADAAEQISGTDRTSDAYKAEAARQMLDTAGVETPSYLSDDSLVKIYDSLISNSEGLKENYDLLENGMNNWKKLSTEDQQHINEMIKAFGESRGYDVESIVGGANEGRLRLRNGDEIVDFDWQDVVSNWQITEVIEKQLKNINFNETFADSLLADKENLKAKYKDLFTEILGSSDLLNRLTDDQLEALSQASEKDMKYISNEQDMTDYLNEKASNKNRKYDNPDLTVDQLTQYKNTKAGVAGLNEEIEKLTQHLRDHAEEIDGVDKSLKFCKEDARDLAEAIIRFDDALQDVEENYDNWSQLLDAGDAYSLSKAVDQLGTAYANLLDMDSSDFTEGFLTSKKNLELFNQVLTGTEEEAIAAYNELARLAEVSFIQVTLDVDKTQAENLVAWFEDITNQLSSYSIHMEIDDADAIAKLESFINTVASSEEQAAEILSNMGYDAEVIQEPVTEEEKRKIIDLVPKDIAGKWVDIPVAAQDPEQPIKTQQVYYPGIGYNGMPSEVVAKSQKTATALKIKSLRKNGKGVTGGGNIKIKNSPTRSSYQGNGGKGSGGGGGGGSQPKQKTPKQHKEKAFLEDRYHNIKSAIDEVAKALERVDKLKERAYGKAKLKYMDQEIDKLKDQVRLQNEYIREAKAYLAIDRSKLEALGGAQFTEDGRLLNYEQVLQGVEDRLNAARDEYNAAVDVYNSTTEQNDDEEEAWKETEEKLQKAEEQAKKEQDIIKQYEETYNVLQDQLDKRADLLNQIYDAELAKTVWKVEIQIEVNDADIKYLEWLNKYLERTEGHVLDIMANLSKAAERTENNINAVFSGFTDLFNNHGIDLGNFDNLDADALVTQLRSWMNQEGLGSEITEEEAKQIRDWNNKLMEYANQWLELWDKTHKQVDDMFDKQNEKFGREIEKFEEYTDILDHYIDIIDLTGAQLGVSREDALQIYDTKISNGRNEIESLITEQKTIQEELDRARTELAEAATEEAKAQWENTVKIAEDKLKEVDGKIRSTWSDTLKWANDRFEKALDAAAYNFNERFNNLQLLTERFDRQLKADHLYLDDYEKYYELNKDAKELEKMINNTNNAMMKSKYNDYLDEINGYMSSGVKLSQAQTDLVEKRVALLKAEDELLNARNAKNAVRMTRDDEGNFSYTYTADQEAIDDAELGYNEAFYNLQKSTRDYQENTQSEMLNYVGEFASQSQDLLKQAKNGDITQEEYEEAMAELEAQYQEYLQWYLEQMQFFYDEEATLRDEDLINLEDITGLKLANYEDFVTDYEDSVLGRLFDDVSSEEEFVQLALESASELLQENVAAGEQWEADIAAICDSAGVDVDTFRETMLNDLTQIDQKSNETKQNITKMSEQMKADMNAIMSKALEMDQDWANHMQSMVQKISETVNAMNQMLEKLADVSNYEHIAGEQAEFAAGNIREMGEQASEAAVEMRELAAATNAAADAMERLNAANAGNPGNYDGGNSSFSGTNYATGDYMQANTSSGSTTIINYGQGGSYGRGNNYIWGGSAQGAYTGAWGPEGKWELLHEKELILNKTDTSNILSAVDMVRNMTNPTNWMHELGNIIKDMFNNNFSMSQQANIGASDLNQNVHIEASFPNVQSHSEIELAINNLINSATQYVNRK